MALASSKVARFGVFELDVGARELRKRGVRVKLQDQPFRVLEALLETPGEIVTREQLKDRLWDQDEFVEFDKSLNTAVQKIRQALGDSATAPRFLETIPRRGYRFVAPVELSQPAPGPSAEPASSRPSSWKWALVAIGLVGAAAVVGVFWPTDGHLDPSDYRIARLTFDSGLTSDPAISADGTLVAYASGRAGRGDLNIWVQQVSGGGAVQLTDNPADDRYPHFSPDGGTIAFESRREDAGIYVVSALGGEPKLLAPEGRLPRFSPDGKLIAYYLDYALYVVSIDGGEPRPVNDQLIAPVLNTSPPLWTKDGMHLIYAAGISGRWDWWLAPAAGGEAKAMGAQAALSNQGLGRAEEEGYRIPPGPDSWDTDGSIVFSAMLGSTENLWKFKRPGEDWQVAGPAARVTFGAAVERQAAIAENGTMVFATRSGSRDIWCAYAAPDNWAETDKIERLTSGPPGNLQATVSADGDRIVFLSDRSGQRDVWYEDLASGQEGPLTTNPETEAFPVISRDGSKVAFVVRTPGQHNPVFVAEIDRGGPRKLCEDCGGSVRSWRFDGAKFLFQSVRSIFVMDSQTGRLEEYLRGDQSPLSSCRVSWDDRWLVFEQMPTPQTRSLHAARLDESSPPASDEWIEITDGSYWDTKPRWSPNGKFLYFTSNRDGFRCIWVQRLELTTKRPIGEPYPIQHFHRAGLSMHISSELAVARDKLVFDLIENTGNVWIMTAPGQE